MKGDGSHMRLICLLTLLAIPALAQDGPSLYKDRCAKCHDNPQPRVPSLATIKEMSPASIYTALTGGIMKTEAAGLSTAQIFSLIGYIAPTGGRAKQQPVSLTPTCKDNPPFKFDSAAPSWNGWSTSPTNSRFEDAKAAGLSAASVRNLKLKWAFNLGDVTVARAQPTVAGGRVFITTQSGQVWSLDAKTGCTHWGFQAAAGPRGGVTLGETSGTPATFFSEAGGTMYALNASTGTQLWKTKPTDQFATLATAAPRYYKGVVYQPYSSFEETIAADPKYTCCTFRGSVVALDAATGKTLWQSYTITDARQKSGPSGAAVWSTPTIDEKLGVLYIATGDNYSDPPTNTSDAVLAMDLKTGKLLWSKQLTAGDAFNNSCSVPGGANCPTEKGPDFDFGQPPILVDLGGGKRALVIAQKSGVAHAIDPDAQGKILWQTRVGTGGPIGGSQWGSASDGRNVYVAVSDLAIGAVRDPNSPQGFRLTIDLKKLGSLNALDLKTGKVVWTAKAPSMSAAVTVIPGVVFAGSVDGHMRAYSTTDGTLLWDTDTAHQFDTVNGKPANGGSIDGAGPAVLNGMVFFNSGYAQWGGTPGNALLAFQ